MRVLSASMYQCQVDDIIDFIRFNEVAPDVKLRLRLRENVNVPLLKIFSRLNSKMDDRVIVIAAICCNIQQLRVCINCAYQDVPSCCIPVDSTLAQISFLFILGLVDLRIFGW